LHSEKKPSDSASVDETEWVDESGVVLENGSDATPWSDETGVGSVVVHKTTV
jgi:hypothetical protein